jgi:hypothetical protein
MEIKLMEDRGLMVWVYSSHGDFTNDGVTAGKQNAVLFDVKDGNISQAFADRLGYPKLRLSRNAFGDLIAVPLEAPDDGRSIGPMMGGNYIASSDSRFTKAIGFYGAVPVHDRYETPAEYASLSA